MNSGWQFKKFVLDTKGVGKVLKSDGVLDLVRKEAEKRSDAGTHVKDFIGFDRARAHVYPNTEENPG